MKTIGFLCKGYYTGGTERVTDYLTMGLLEKADCRVVLISTGFDAISRERAEQIGYVIEEIPDFNLSVHGAEFQAAVADAVNRQGVDILVTLSSIILSRPSEFRKLIDHPIKLIFHLHTSVFGEVRRRMYEARMRNAAKSLPFALWHWYLTKNLKEQLFKTYSKRIARSYVPVLDEYDHFVVLCESYREELKTYFPEERINNVVAMYNPSDLANFGGDYDIDAKKKEVLYVGRLFNRDKRVDFLVRAWSHIEARYPDWKLKIVGDGPDRWMIEAETVRLGLKKVVFCGHSSDPSEHYRSADIIALTSIFEGWGMVLVEAMAGAAVPIVTDSGAGVRELVGDGRGVLVSSDADEREFAAELARLMDDRDGRASRVAGYKDFLRRFDLGVTVDRWIQFLGLTEK